MSRRRRRGNTFFRGAAALPRGYIASELRKMGDDVLPAATEALHAGAEKIAERARDNLRNQNAVRTGNLIGSIKVEKRNQDGTSLGISANAKNKKGYLYGQIIEFSPTKGRPFLYPAFDALRGEVMEDVTDAVRKAIRGNTS